VVLIISLMYGKSKGKIMADAYTNYPQSARNNAKKVLNWKKEHGSEVKAMTPTGWRRASQLASGDAISYDTVKRIAAFERHRENSKIDPKYKSTPWKDNGYVAWLGWGGSSAIAWAKRIVASKEKKSKNEAVVRSIVRNIIREEFDGKKLNPSNTHIMISNVSEERKYAGAYKRIFKILNADSIFIERYETDESIGFVNGKYYLEIEGSIDSSEYEKISKIKNVEIID
jgi:hypothetical protein